MHINPNLSLANHQFRFAIWFHRLSKRYESKFSRSFFAPSCRKASRVLWTRWLSCQVLHGFALEISNRRHLWRPVLCIRLEATYLIHGPCAWQIKPQENFSHMDMPTLPSEPCASKLFSFFPMFSEYGNIWQSNWCQLMPSSSAMFIWTFRFCCHMVAALRGHRAWDPRQLLSRWCLAQICANAQPKPSFHAQDAWIIHERFKGITWHNTWHNME